MSTERPYFSVVIPTRNRGELLRYSIQSLLEQTFNDFEVVVSNNSSSDNTKEVVNSFNDKRIRYVETPQSFEMIDSWRFALKYAKGEYITFLSDDDACSIDTLEIIAEVIKQHKNNRLFVWNMCDYSHYPTSLDKRKVILDTVSMRPFNGRISIVDSKRVIKDRFAMADLLSEIPQESDFRKFPALVNTVYHNSIFGDIKKRGLKFLHPSCRVGDIYALVVVLHIVSEFVYIDFPLHIHRDWEQSATTSIEGSRKYYKESKEELLVPFKCYTNKTFAANALLWAKKDLGSDLGYIDIDWMTFFQSVYSELCRLKTFGLDISEEMKSFNDALDGMPLDFQQQVRSKFLSKAQEKRKSLTYKAKFLLRPTIMKLKLNRVTDLIRKNKTIDSTFSLVGAEEGFDNILDFARKIDRKWLNDNKINL